MRDPSRIEVHGPLAPYAGGYLTWLARRGYSLSWKVFHLRLMAQISDWLEAKVIPVSVLDGATAEQFLADRHGAGRLLQARIGSVALLLEYVRSVKAVPPVVVVTPVSPTEQLLARYCEYLCVELGLSADTAERSMALIRPFLTDLQQAGRIDFGRISTETVTRFVLQWLQQQPKTLDRRVSALRSLLRFLHVQGLIETDCAQAVPAVHRPRLAGLPKALPSEQVAAMLASCDRGTRVGRRDLAILTVLAYI